MKAFVVVISGLLLAAPAFAQANGSGGMTGSGASIASGQSEQPDGASTTEGGEGESRRICRRVEIASGALSFRRLCMTARQWRDFTAITNCLLDRRPAPEQQDRLIAITGFGVIFEAGFLRPGSTPHSRRDDRDDLRRPKVSSAQAKAATTASVA